MELGGKNAGIVFADCRLRRGRRRHRARELRQHRADLPRHRARATSSDRSSTSSSPALKVKAEGMKIGRPEDEGTQLGPLISHEHRKKVLSYLQEGRRRGREGRHRRRHPGHARRSWPKARGSSRRSGPGCPKRRTVVQEEIFGPCCHVHAVRHAKTKRSRWRTTRRYGLATTVWTTQPRRERTASRRKIDVGICWINSWFLRDLRTAFGGSKDSGIGREGGVHSLEFYTELAQRLREARSGRSDRAGRAARSEFRAPDGTASPARKPRGPHNERRRRRGGAASRTSRRSAVARTRRTISRRWCRPSA